jgi:huntingtin-interacting protein 1-related protein
MQIDDLLAKLDRVSGELEHQRDEKDQEIAILQEGMDHTLQQLSEVQQVCFWTARQ